MGNSEIVQKVMKEFTIKTESQLALIREAAAAHDLETLILNAHSIKGSGRTLEVGNLAEKAALLETAGKEAQWSNIPLYIEALDDAYRELCTYLESYQY